MYSSLLFGSLWAALSAFAQDDAAPVDITSSFTEPNTGIQLQVSAPHGTSGMKFGIALPKTGGKSFIGFFSGSAESAPWAGASLGGPVMLGNLLAVAFPYNSVNKVKSDACKIPIGDVRTATGYTNDDVQVYKGEGAAKVVNKPIKKGTFAKGSDWQYMFLCENCMVNSSLVFDQKEQRVQIGYVAGPAAPSAHFYGARLVEHTGRAALSFGLNITASKSDKFDEWAKLAEAPSADCAPTPEQEEALKPKPPAPITDEPAQPSGPQGPMPWEIQASATEAPTEAATSAPAAAGTASVSTSAPSAPTQAPSPPGAAPFGGAMGAKSGGKGGSKGARSNRGGNKSGNRGQLPKNYGKGSSMRGAPKSGSNGQFNGFPKGSFPQAGGKGFGH
ncbi:hypothetical protein BT63DRAFT_460232 [Microthyrium microscopicum]|uniref:Cellobiose dehydrogenase-like cytochrome domain-containing protein n=1 Tax=Microthyrium microscopicum TaxID=703497 RepID=A0A6A6TYF4_9PEZI|nr:hypothetical protein BT63DRAFT_460232 [Microthyrium microscopicum]